jgi:hypothetical protein
MHTILRISDVVSWYFLDDTGFLLLFQNVLTFPPALWVALELSHGRVESAQGDVKIVLQLNGSSRSAPRQIHLIPAVFELRTTVEMDRVCSTRIVEYTNRIQSPERSEIVVADGTICVFPYCATESLS